MKKITTLILFLSVIFIFFISIYLFTGNDTVVAPIVTAPISDVKNTSYTIEGRTITLKNGKASEDIAPGSATQYTVNMFGEPVYGDLNGDGAEDAAIMLETSSGGSGRFYYAVLAIATDNGYVTTNALLLGDRIAPQTIEIRDGQALYNYAERKAGDPMTTQPSVGKTFYVYYDRTTKEIGELVKNFEGEADPSKMALDMKKWEWVKTIMNDGSVITPTKAGIFSLTFTRDGNVTIGTDCNHMGGSYTKKDNTLTFNPIISTEMYCEGSQEGTFSKALRDVIGYSFTSKGELLLEIKMDSGTMVFK